MRITGVLDCSTVVGESTVVTVTATYEGVTYTGTLGIQKVVDGPAVVENMWCDRSPVKDRR